jgi:hypothetical protein
MFGSVAKNKKPQGTTSPEVSSIKPQPKHQGRERLQFFVAEAAKASQAIEDLQERISRLGAIIVESDNAQRALQEAINADGGVALAAYSAGNAKPDDPISKLVSHAKMSSEAADAAKLALPHTEALLQNAREQLVTLGEQRNAELNRVIAMLADNDARAYEKAFSALCVLHDKLCGFASVSESNIGDVRLIVDPVKVPRFASPSLGNADADPFLRHRESEMTINESRRRWAEIRSRLERDAEADIDDLRS